RFLVLVRLLLFYFFIVDPPAEIYTLSLHVALPISHGYQVHVGPMYSNSRGHLKIKSKDPFEKPEFVFNYLSTEEDKRDWVEAIKVARNILSQKGLDPFNGGEISPGPEVQTDEEIIEWVKRDGETALQPSCSCRMGPKSDEMS